MEIARAFGLAFLVLFAILAATAAVVIVVNLITGGTLYITGSANRDLVALVNILSTALLALIWKRWRKSRSANPTTVSQADHPIA